MLKLLVSHVLLARIAELALKKIFARHVQLDTFQTLLPQLHAMPMIQHKSMSLVNLLKEPLMLTAILAMPPRTEKLKQKQLLPPQLQPLKLKANVYAKLCSLKKPLLILNALHALQMLPLALKIKILLSKLTLVQRISSLPVTLALLKLTLLLDSSGTLFLRPANSKLVMLLVKLAQLLETQLAFYAQTDQPAGLLLPKQKLIMQPI